MQYSLSDLVIDTRSRTIRRGDDTIRLSDLSFDVLVALIEGAPEPLSGADLANAVWQSKHVSNETIAQRIALLRKALGDDSKHPRYIRTVRGNGYAVLGQIARVEVPTRSPSRRPPFAIPVMALTATACLMVVSLSWFSDEHPPNPLHDDAHSAEDGERSAALTRARALLALHQSVETDRAIGMLREVLAGAPEDFDARLSLSFALSTKATKFGGEIEHKQEAEALARALTQERPTSSNAWSALGYSLGSQGRMNESLSALQYAYQLDANNAPAGSSAAYVHLLQGQLYEALTLEFRVRASGGRSRYAEIQIAQSLELIGHPSAPNWHARALRLNPGQVVVLGEIARSHLRHGRPGEALDTLAQVEGKDALAPSILQLRGRANIALGKLGLARQQLQAAGRQGVYALAALDALAGSKDRAVELLSPAKLAQLNADPEPQFRIQLAEVAAASGDERQALGLIAQAVTLGWRDNKWLTQSPFIGALMETGEGRKLQRQIRREIEVQRRLTEGNPTLEKALRG